LKAVVRHVLRTGANVLEDVAEGKSFKESAIKRVPEGLRSVRIRDKTPRVLSAGANLIDDVSEGKSLKEAAIKRIPKHHRRRLGKNIRGSTLPSPLSPF
jgi:hypothetical protein